MRKAVKLKQHLKSSIRHAHTNPARMRKTRSRALEPHLYYNARVGASLIDGRIRKFVKFCVSLETETVINSILRASTAAVLSQGRKMWEKPHIVGR